MVKEVKVRWTTALVDDEDFEKVSHYKWSAGTGYARTTLSRENGKSKTTSMHRMIMNAPPHLEVDHINGNKLDNRKENLRLCEHHQNVQNIGLTNANKTGYKGVSKRANGKYVAMIQSKGVIYRLGTFDNPHEAAKVYNEKAKELHGEFAFLNKIKEEVTS